MNLICLFVLLGELVFLMVECLVVILLVFIIEIIRVSFVIMIVVMKRNNNIC